MNEGEKERKEGGDKEIRTNVNGGRKEKKKKRRKKKERKPEKKRERMRTLFE